MATTQGERNDLDQIIYFLALAANHIGNEPELPIPTGIPKDSKELADTITQTIQWRAWEDERKRLIQEYQEGGWRELEELLGEIPSMLDSFRQDSSSGVTAEILYRAHERIAELEIQLGIVLPTQKIVKTQEETTIPEKHTDGKTEGEEEKPAPVEGRKTIVDVMSESQRSVFELFFTQDAEGNWVSRNKNVSTEEIEEIKKVTTNVTDIIFAIRNYMYEMGMEWYITLGSGRKGEYSAIPYVKKSPETLAFEKKLGILELEDESTKMISKEKKEELLIWADLLMKDLTVKNFSETEYKILTAIISARGNLIRSHTIKAVAVLGKNTSLIKVVEQTNALLQLHNLNFTIEIYGTHPSAQKFRIVQKEKIVEPEPTPTPEPGVSSVGKAEDTDKIDLPTNKVFQYEIEESDEVTTTEAEITLESNQKITIRGIYAKILTHLLKSGRLKRENDDSNTFVAVVGVETLKKEVCAIAGNEDFNTEKINNFLQAIQAKLGPTVFTAKLEKKSGDRSTFRIEMKGAQNVQIRVQKLDIPEEAMKRIKGDGGMNKATVYSYLLALRDAAKMVLIKPTASIGEVLTTPKNLNEVANQIALILTEPRVKPSSSVPSEGYSIEGGKVIFKHSDIQTWWGGFNANRAGLGSAKAVKINGRGTHSFDLADALETICKKSSMEIPQSLKKALLKAIEENIIHLHESKNS